MSSPSITFLGHAGFIVRGDGVTILMDPWFFPAFLESWFPLPDNRFMLEPVRHQSFDMLYVSHLHEDHFDARFLRDFPKTVPVLCPAYRSRSLEKQLRALGFSDIRHMSHRTTVQLADKVTATMLLDQSHKEDSGLLLNLDGFSFLDLNDCNVRLDELPHDIDLLAMQYSGAMWYPNCYDYAPTAMAQKVAEVHSNLLNACVRKVQTVAPKFFAPSAGPPCFLDPMLRAFNDPETTIFLRWAQMAEAFAVACPQVRVMTLAPGDRLDFGGEQPAHRRPAPPVMEQPLEGYAQSRQAEWQAFASRPHHFVTDEDLCQYFASLHRRNRHLARSLVRTFGIVAESGNMRRCWRIDLRGEAGVEVTRVEATATGTYVFRMPSGVLHAIVSGRCSWETALLSMRVHVWREPDIFDSQLLGFLRYGSQPAQTLQMVRQAQASGETIDYGGYCIQRYCPHAGEDLHNARLANGILECPRHQWQWELDTGRCIKGGDLPLKVAPRKAGNANAHQEGWRPSGSRSRS